MGIKMCIMETHPLPSVVKYFYDFLGGIWTDCSPGEWNLGQLLPEQTVAKQPWLPLQSDSSAVILWDPSPLTGHHFVLIYFTLLLVISFTMSQIIATRHIRMAQSPVD